MALSQDGDQRAYVALLTTITPYLRSLTRRFGIGSEETEDGVQDVLMALHAVRHTYDPKRPFAPWLVAIARHRLVDRTRRRSRILARETALDETDETFAVDDAKLHERTSDARRLRAAISALPARQQQAIEMLRFEELSLREASALSGQSETALKVAMHRAIKRLRLQLAGEW